MAMVQSLPLTWNFFKGGGLAASFKVWSPATLIDPAFSLAAMLVKCFREFFLYQEGFSICFTVFCQEVRPVSFVWFIPPRFILTKRELTKG